MTKPANVVVLGGANSDFLVKAARLPGPGKTVEGDEFQQGPGGKGANQAVAAARLGARVSFIARLGADARGDELLAGLRAEGVDVSLVVRDARHPSGVALVMVDGGGEKQIMTAPGANRRLDLADVHAAEARIAGADILLMQLEVPLECVEAAASIARAAGVRVVLDPAPPQPLGESLLRDLHVIRPNADEAEVLTGVEVDGEPAARNAAQNLLDRGASAAIVGAPGGNLLASARGTSWFPHLEVKSVDATGAGDAFAAALAVALAEDHSLHDAARFAGAAAAFATTRLGAQAGLPRREDVLALLRRST